MNNYNTNSIFVGFIAFIAVVVLDGLVIGCIWNWVVSDLLPVSLMTYPQALGLSFLYNYLRDTRFVFDTGNNKEDV